MKHLLRAGLCAVLSSCAAAAGAMTDAELVAVATKRLQGDRTGACMAIALVEKTVATAYVCADPKDNARIDARTAFEIGSISKTFTAVLLADQIAAGKMRLDDPLWLYLPKGTRVPGFKGVPITLRHLVTHTSGLPPVPSRMVVRDGRNPFSAVTEQQLLQSLAEAKLTQAPGTKWEYSNFAVMLLSHVLAKQYGQDLEVAMRQRLFTPLGMTGSFVAAMPPRVRFADGHLASGEKTVHWDLPVNLAGAGGFRSTLPDMVRYVEANLGLRAAPIAQAISMTHDEAANADNTRMGMGWVIMPVGDHTLHMHEGTTGGFSSLVALDKERQRGVVVLSDTSFSTIGGLSELGLHLLDPSLPMRAARAPTTPDPLLIDALAGWYRLENGMEINLRRKGAALEMQLPGQGAWVLNYDSNGDFFLPSISAVLRPRAEPGGYRFSWLQGGALMEARRLDGKHRVVEPLSSSALAEYAGEYPLLPQHTLRVFVLGNRLMAQPTGQGAFPLDHAVRDVFVSSQVGAELRFERKDGRIAALTLRNDGGNELRAERRAAAAD